MGHRISANLPRVGLLRSWNSVWYSRLEYTYLVSLDYRIRDFVDNVFYNLKWPISEMRIKRFLSRTVVLEILVYIPEDRFFSRLNFGAFNNVYAVPWHVDLFKFNNFVHDFNYISRFLYRNIFNKSVFFLLVNELRRYLHYDNALFRYVYRNLAGFCSVSLGRSIEMDKAKKGTMGGSDLISHRVKKRGKLSLLYVYRSEFVKSIPIFLRLMRSKRKSRFLKRKGIRSLAYNLFTLTSLSATRFRFGGLKHHLHYFGRARRRLNRFRKSVYRWEGQAYSRFKCYSKYDPFAAFARYGHRNPKMLRRYRRHKWRLPMGGTLNGRASRIRLLVKKQLSHISRFKCTRRHVKTRLLRFPIRFLQPRYIRRNKKVLGRNLKGYSLKSILSNLWRGRSSCRGIKVKDIVRLRKKISFRRLILKRHLSFFRARRRFFRLYYSSFYFDRKFKKKGGNDIKFAAKHVFGKLKSPNEVLGSSHYFLSPSSRYKGRLLAKANGRRQADIPIGLKTFARRNGGKGFSRTDVYRKSFVNSGRKGFFTVSGIRTRSILYKPYRQGGFLLSTFPKRRLITLFVRALHYSFAYGGSRCGMDNRQRLRSLIARLFFVKSKGGPVQHKAYSRKLLLKRFVRFNRRTKRKVAGIGTIRSFKMLSSFNNGHGQLRFFLFFDNLWYFNSGINHLYKVNLIVRNHCLLNFNQFFLVVSGFHRLLLIGKFVDFFNFFKFENSVFVSIKLLRFFKRLVVNASRPLRSVISEKVVLFIVFMFCYVDKRWSYAQLFLHNLLNVVTYTLSVPVVSISYQLRVCVYLFIYYFYNHLKVASTIVRVLRLLYTFRVGSSFLCYSRRLVVAGKYIRDGRSVRKRLKGRLVNLSPLRSFLLKFTRNLTYNKGIGGNAKLRSGVGTVDLSRVTFSKIDTEKKVVIGKKRRKGLGRYLKLYRCYLHVQTLFFLQASYFNVLLDNALVRVRVNSFLVSDNSSFAGLLINTPSYWNDIIIRCFSFRKSYFKYHKTLGLSYTKHIPNLATSRQLRNLLVRKRPYFVRYVIDHLVYYLDSLRREVAPVQLVSFVNLMIEYNLSAYLNTSVVFMPIYYLSKTLPLTQAKMVCLFVSFQLEKGIPYFFVLKQIGMIAYFHSRRRGFTRNRSLRNIKGIFYNGISGIDKYIYKNTRREYRRYKRNIYSVCVLRYSLFRMYNSLGLLRGFVRNAGIRVCCSGRMHRRQTRSHTVWFVRGASPMRTFGSYIDYYSFFAVTALGVLGVKAWIYMIQINASAS